MSVIFGEAIAELVELESSLWDWSTEEYHIEARKDEAWDRIHQKLLQRKSCTSKLGQVVSMDDGIYSSAVVMEFFQELQKCRVPVHTRIGFAKAIAGFYEFLNVYIDAGGSAVIKWPHINIFAFEALMFYIVQCNTARNEVIYKTKFKRVFDFSEKGYAQTGLRRNLDGDGGKKELGRCLSTNQVPQSSP
ncbi:unnamed protein product [Cylicostephanus goldi]|uniref:MADF domain-containing protein n=1 Tax=Cylicostephanus goldi TaxID=71465 RepID=A0A3P7PLQ5_CYLGO|nr:unnamed protein product [Cylicostephanus goldi]